MLDKVGAAAAFGKQNRIDHFALGGELQPTHNLDQPVQTAVAREPDLGRQVAGAIERIEPGRPQGELGEDRLDLGDDFPCETPLGGAHEDLRVRRPTRERLLEQFPSSLGFASHPLQVGEQQEAFAAQGARCPQAPHGLEGFVEPARLDQGASLAGGGAAV